MSILILSSPDDVHADAVSRQLKRLGAEFRCFTFAMLTEDLEIKLSLDSYSEKKRMTLVPATGAVLDLSQVEAVWFRRPGKVRYSGLPEPWMNSMVESELQATILGILRSLNCLFVNHPGRDSECLFKLWQLEAARRVGLHYPPTIVTNDPKLVAEFYDRCKGQVIYKLISEKTNHSIPKYESSYSVPTLPFTQEDLQHVDQVSLAPHLFQERIEKQYDIRVTAIGKKLFPVKIDSQKGKGSIDWRMDYSVPMDLIELPTDVHNACLMLMEELGLNYGAIDLCVDREGRYVFFEINCAGQYLWMENRIGGLELSLELAKLLVGESEPMVPPVRAGMQASLSCD